MSIHFDEWFYQEPYRRSMEAVVIGCEGPDRQGLYEIQLDRSIFYPEGGGQPGDRGRIQDLEVLDTHYRGEKIVHITRGALDVGSTVHAEIDWERRFELMQQHSGEHLISGLAKQFYGCRNVGFHISETEMTLDFDRELSPEDCEQLETEANLRIFQNLPIRVVFPTPEEREHMDYRSKKPLEGEVRLIEVPGVDLCACCGTHLANTGEIGLVKLVRRERYKGGVRLTALCGIRALRDYRALQEEAEALSRLFSQKSRELLPALTALSEDFERLKMRLQDQNYALLDILAESHAGEEAIVWIRPAAESASLRQLAKAASRSFKRLAVLLAPSDGGFRYVLASENASLDGLHERLKENFELRGGGRDGFFQGSLVAKKQPLLDFLSEESPFVFDESLREEERLAHEQK